MDTNLSQPMGQAISKSQMLIFGIVAILLLGGFLFWFLTYGKEKAVPSVTPPAENTTEELGSQLYKAVENPIEGEVPSANPAVNPIEDLYANPFE